MIPPGRDALRVVRTEIPVEAYVITRFMSVVVQTLTWTSNQDMRSWPHIYAKWTALEQCDDELVNSRRYLSASYVQKTFLCFL